MLSIILILLLKSKKKQLSQKILILFFIFLLFVVLFLYSGLHDIRWLFNISFIQNDITTMLIGPLLYLYIKSLFLSEKKLIRNTLIHFIPVALYAIFIAIPTLLYSIFKTEELSYVISDHTFVFIRIENLYLILYLILSLQLLSKYRKVVKASYSNLSQYDYYWIKIMLYGALFIISVDLSIKIYESFFGDFIWYQEYLIVAAMIILVFYLGYYGVNQSKVLLPDFLLKEDRYGKGCRVNNKMLSNANKKEFEVLMNRLELVMTTNHPYLDENLTLGKLAGQLSTTDKKLSTLLNQYMDTTFYDLINKYRVEAVIEKMRLEHVYENYNLFGIACECGFKSRTSFNRIFKKETGYSPSAYKKSLS